MKKFLSLMLLLCMAFSLFALAGCDDSSTDNSKDPFENLYEDFEEFDSYVPRDSEIVGVWDMTSPETNFSWQFFGSTTLHQTEHIGDISTSTICIYNYDGEGNLKVYAFTEKVETAYTVVLEGDNLTLTAEDGSVLTFVRQK